MRANDIDTVKTLMTGGADVEAGDLFKETPLHLAALIADYDVVLELLEKRPDINARTRFGNTVLHFAVRRENDPDKVVDRVLGEGRRHQYPERRRAYSNVLWDIWVQ